jgi:hypothetical protein
MMQKIIFTGVLAISFVLTAFSQKNLKPIISSHNFVNKNELWESVGYGILNFQADVMYIYGKNYVTTLMPDSANHKLPTLLDAYLYPLFNQFKKNNGEIIPGYQGNIYLILNFTNQPYQVYKQLANEMRPLVDMLSFELETVKHPGKLRILIKDKNHLEIINSIKPNFLGLVGNLADIDKNFDSYKMPLIEIDFSEITKWKGTGNIPFEDFLKIKELVTKVHAQNKKLSIINCPTYKSIADMVQTSKADFINTQEAIKMAGFFEVAK